MRNPTRLKVTGDEEGPKSMTYLTGASHVVQSVIFLVECNLFVAASYDGSARVYTVDTAGGPTVVF